MKPDVLDGVDLHHPEQAQFPVHVDHGPVCGEGEVHVDDRPGPGPVRLLGLRVVEPGVVLDVLPAYQVPHRGYQDAVLPDSLPVEFVSPSPLQGYLAGHPGRFHHRSPGHLGLAGSRGGARRPDLGGVVVVDDHVLDTQDGAGDLGARHSETLAHLDRGGVHLHSERRDHDPGLRVVVETGREAQVLEADGITDPPFAPPAGRW